MYGLLAVVVLASSIVEERLRYSFPNMSTQCYYAGICTSPQTTTSPVQLPATTTEVDQIPLFPQTALPEEAQDNSVAEMPWHHASLAPCLTALHALLPGLAGTGEGVRALMEVHEQDDLEWMLNTANAELHCCYAEQLQQLGQADAALDNVTKVSTCHSHTVASALSTDFGALVLVILPSCIAARLSWMNLPLLLLTA